jgi:hypothetical protein
VSPGPHAAGDGSFGRSAGLQAGRATILIAVAVLIGFVLLHRSPGAASIGTLPSGPSATTKTTGQGGGSVPTSALTTPPTVALRTPQSIKVLVANGTSSIGLAGRISDALHAKGYNTLSPTDASQHPTSSFVYFEPSYGSDAAALASKLNLPATAVSAMPTPPPVAKLNGANILVVAGPNLLSSASTTSTT